MVYLIVTHLFIVDSKIKKAYVVDEIEESKKYGKKITLLLGYNVLGDKMPILEVDKSKKTKCLHEYNLARKNIFIP